VGENVPAISGRRGAISEESVDAESARGQKVWAHGDRTLVDGSRCVALCECVENRNSENE